MSTETDRRPIDRIEIDETYTYVFDNGIVTIERNGQPWLEGFFPGSKAWISAACEIERLREENAALRGAAQSPPNYVGLDATGGVVQGFGRDADAAMAALLDPTNDTVDVQRIGTDRKVAP